MLDRQVEHWRVLQARGAVRPEQFILEADTSEARCKEPIERVLRDYDPALQTTIERLSVARRFDRAAFTHIVTTFKTGLPADRFEHIAELSFVTRSSDGFFNLHNVIAAAIRDQLTEEKRQTSVAALFEHFSARAVVASHFDLNAENIAALFEAAYLRRAEGLDGYFPWLVSATEPLRQAARYEPNTALWSDALAIAEKV